MLLARWWSIGPAALWVSLGSSLLPGRMQQSKAAETRANLGGMQPHKLLLLLLLLTVQVGSSNSERVTIEVTSTRSWTGKIAPEPAPIGFNDAEKIAKLVKADLPVFTFPQREGWTLPKNNVYQSYMCRFSALDQPCWDFPYFYFGESGYVKYPMSLYCPPGSCCSGSNTQTVCRVQCGTVNRWNFMDAHHCTCQSRGKMCGPDSDCDDSARSPWGGTVCRCKKGLVGDGVTCHPDPCADKAKNKCHPGECKARPNGHSYCVCPHGYYWNDFDPFSPECLVADTCVDNPCGPKEAVLECRTDEVLQYTCVCREGYQVGSVDGKPRCVRSKANVIKCENVPCGTDGLLSCADTAEGPDCVCEHNYRLITDKRKKVCVYAPCEGDPCGDPPAVKACIPGLRTYSCACNQGFKVDTVDGQPKCVKDVVDYTIFLIAGGCVLAGILLLVLSCCVLRKRMLKRTSLEQYQYAGIDGMQAAYQDGVGFDSSQWM